MNNKNVPSFDLFKRLDNQSIFLFSKLEDSYGDYDSSNAHRHNYYEVLIFNKSGGTHEIDFETIDIKKNSIHFVSPEQIHLLKRDKNVTGYLISFTKELYFVNNPSFFLFDSFPFFDNPNSSSVISELNEIEFQNFSELISKITLEFNEENEDKLEVLKSILITFLLLSKRYYLKSSGKLEVPLLKNEMSLKFKKLVNSQFKTTRNVTEYASLLNISAGHLSDTLKVELGKTALELINDRVLLEAKRLLYYSHLSMKEISVELNFNDASYFSRFFKEKTNTSPEIFREQIRKKYK